MEMEVIIDRIVQFLGHEIINILINKLSVAITMLITLSNRNSSMVEVLYKSDNFIAINKPPDLLINSNDPVKISVQTILKKEFPGLADDTLCNEFYFAHRLDFATSGILCIPLNKKACTAISQTFENRKSGKYYVAILKGHIDQEGIIIDVPVGEDIRFKNINNKMCTSNDWEHCLKPRDCLTKLLVLEKGYYKTEFATKVLLKPITGRRHQLRVHCNEIGHPIIGDYTYCNNGNCNELPRMMLHALRLILPNPIENLDIKAPDPFTENSLDQQWIVKETLNEYSIAFDKIDNI